MMNIFTLFQIRGSAPKITLLLLNSTLLTSAITPWRPSHEAVVNGTRRGAAFDAGTMNGVDLVHMSDIDGDGDLDAFRMDTGRVFFNENRGTPTTPIWSPRIHDYFAPNFVSNLNFIDVDRDNDVDMIYIESHFNPEFRWRENIGSASTPEWAPTATASFLPAIETNDIKRAPLFTFRDLNNDGTKDLMVALLIDPPTPQNRDLEIWYYQESGTNDWGSGTRITSFNAEGLTLTGSGVPRFLDAVDLDLDGDRDLVLGGLLKLNGTDYEASWIIENTGTTSSALWASPQQQTNPSDWLPHRVGTEAFGFADIDGDQDDDVWGHLGLRTTTGSTTNTSWSAPEHSFLSIQRGRRSRPQLADLDADGDLELLWLSIQPNGNPDSPLTLFNNIGFTAAAIWEQNPSNALPELLSQSDHLVYADMDEDADLDLIVAGWQNITWMENTGSITVAKWAPQQPTPSAWSIEASSIFSAVAVKDINHDGLPDLLTYNAASQELHLRLNHSLGGHAQFGSTNTLLNLSTLGSSPSVTTLELSDLDGNGTLDISFINQPHSSGEYRLYSMLNTGTVLSASWATPEAELSFDSVVFHATGDVDGDGKSDLFVGEQSGYVQHFINDLPDFTISPNLLTLSQTQTVHFAILEPSSNLAWRIIENNSGGNIHPLTGHYTAGTTSGVDLIEAFENNGLTGRAYINIISPTNLAATGKALLLAGGKSLSDPVWKATDRVTQQTYLTLLNKGYQKHNITYLSFETDLDVDGNGLNDDIDGPATLAQLQATFSTLGPDTGNLFVYLSNHGSDSQGSGKMRLNASEFITATNLNTLLTTLQNTASNEVQLIMEFCYAGSFLDEIQNTGPSNRIAIASCASNELTYLIAGGRVSFSAVFMNALLQGANYHTAYTLARDAMSPYQQAQLDDDHSGHYDPDIDGPYAQTLTLGVPQIGGREQPQITQIIPNQDVTPNQSLDFWASGVISHYPLTRVWCVIIPPNHLPDLNAGNPVTDLPEIDLIYNLGQDRYEQQLGPLSQPGVYAIQYFAEDIWGGISFPRQSYIVNQNQPARALIIVGNPGTPTQWPGIKDAVQTAFSGLKNRLLTPANISLLSPQSIDADGDGINDVDAPNTLAEIQRTFSHSLLSSQHITLCLIGNGASNILDLADSDTLTAPQFNQLLSDWESTTNALSSTTLLDFPSAGTWLPTLATTSASRTLLASTRENRPHLMSQGMHFTGYFFQEITQGHSIGQATTSARKTTRRASGNLRQKPLIDDNGNGLPNEKNVDGQHALSQYIGTAFVTGEDLPHIGTTMPNLIISNTSSVTLWASDITDADGISNLTVRITSPTNTLTQPATIKTLTFNAASNRYEILYPDFNTLGIYTLTFQAEDILANHSPVTQAQITQLSTNLQNTIASDSYEPDNTQSNARYSDLPLIQIHSLHTSTDCDWVRFHALSNFVYDIETIHLGTNIDTQIEVYRQATNGLLLIDAVDEFGYAEGELTGLDFPTNGSYYIKICHDTNFPHQAGSYALIVYVPVAVQGINVFAHDILQLTFLQGLNVRLRDAAGTLLDTKTIGTDLAFGDPTFVNFPVPPGNYIVEIQQTNGLASAYSASDSNEVPSNASTDYGNPRNLGDYEFKSVPYGGTTFTDTTFMGFEFFPITTYTGTIHSALTAAPLQNAHLLFTRNSDNTPFDRYPWAPYAPLWATSPQGHTPNNLHLLPNTPYTLTISKPGYSNLTLNVTSGNQGTLHNLGNLLLASQYSSNDIPDHYELTHNLPFNGNTTSDSDNDGLTLLQEWIANTNPNNPNSRLNIPQIIHTNNQISITWHPTPYRTYEIISCPNLTTPLNAWATEFGPWTNTTLLTNKTWTAPINTLTNNIFTIKVSLP